MPEEVDKPNNPTSPLKHFTAARIAIGHTGVSIPLKQLLQFKLAHAHARDAVYSKLDTEKLIAEIQQFNLPVLTIQSQADNRYRYLQRPDQGRQLDKASQLLLNDYAGEYDICFIIADGLSAQAVNTHAVEVLKYLVPLLHQSGFKLSPLLLAVQGRVALGDEIASRLKAKLSLMLIGERPGLSAADSMGAYLTYNPQPGLTDDSRNCISNIRQGGMRFKTAAQKIFYLVQEAFRLKLSGVLLKDNAGLLH